MNLLFNLFIVLLLIIYVNSTVVRINYGDAGCTRANGVDEFQYGICYGDKQFNQFQLLQDPVNPNTFFQWCRYKSMFCNIPTECSLTMFGICFGTYIGPHVQGGAKFMLLKDFSSPSFLDKELKNFTNPLTKKPFVKIVENLGCSQEGQKCFDNNDCCPNLCEPTSCYNGMCIGSTCKGPGYSCYSDCECCSDNCVINDINPGTCG